MGIRWIKLQDFGFDLARAIGFLSRIPLPQRFFENDDGSLSRVVRAFPLAGVIIMLPSALLLAVLLKVGTAPELASLIALTVQIILTGALHEDGFADCADGFWGGRDRNRRLEIMKDSRMGAYGGLALILSVALRAAAIAAIGRSSGFASASMALLAVAALSRTVLVWHWSSLPPAKPDGVAAAVGMPKRGARNLALVTGIGLYALLALFALGAAAMLAGLFFAGLVTAIFLRLTRGKIGGHTGDTLGASQQTAEIAALIALAIAV